MSRGNPFDPVCDNQTTVQTSIPPLTKTAAVAFDPVCRQFTGTQTAVPDLPPTG